MFGVGRSLPTRYGRKLAPSAAASVVVALRDFYIIGPASAPIFGPLMRFVYGAGFTIRRLSRHFAYALSQRRAPRTASMDAEESAGSTQSRAQFTLEQSKQMTSSLQTRQCLPTPPEPR